MPEWAADFPSWAAGVRGREQGTGWEQGTAGWEPDFTPGPHAAPLGLPLRHPAQRHDADRTWAMLGYLGAALLGFIPPLAIYLTSARNSPFLRAHAAQAVNVALTSALYTICGVIVGGALALDSPRAGLVAGACIAVPLWGATLRSLARAATAARHGTYGSAPDWLCAAFLRPPRM